MKHLLIVFAVVFSMFSFAETVTVESSGIGSSLDEAIDSGVRRAIEQVSGVSLDSKRNVSKSYEKSAKDGLNYNKKSQEGTVITSGGNATYRVISESCQSNQCKVKLKVMVEQPDGTKRQKQLKALNKNRRTIAIAPFSGPKSTTITKAIEALFVQDRKFSVLKDRNDPNLDYIITGKIVEAYTHKRVVDNSKTIALTGEHINDVKTYYSSKVLIEYQILDIVSNQIKWSATIPTTSSRNNLSLLMDIASKKVFRELKDNIYPLRIIVAKNGSIILNSGGNTLKVGEYYDVFDLGEVLIDPITKESLGATEQKIATIKVVKVLPKLAYTQVIKGKSSSVRSNQIARKSTYKPYRAVTKKPVKVNKKLPVEEENTDGGIIL